MRRSHTDDGMCSAKGDVEHRPERCVAQCHCVTANMSMMILFYSTGKRAHVKCRRHTMQTETLKVPLGMRLV